MAAYEYNVSAKKANVCSRSALVITIVIVIAVAVAAIVGITLSVKTSSSINDVTATTSAPATKRPPTFPPSTLVTSRYAAVATADKRCSEIGTEMLGRRGGSVVDAAIASMLCIGAMNRHSAGIGGGFFMTVYGIPNKETERRAVTILARETAPAAAHRDMFVNNTISSTIGGLAIGVPGEVAGYWKAWQMFGKLPWRALFEPTIKLFREGYPVPVFLAKAIQNIKSRIEVDENLSVLRNPDGSLLKEGDLAYDAEFADTLESIADDPQGFYNGTLAQAIVEDVAEYGGNITADDLSNYQARVRDALSVHLDNGDLKMYGPPPPSSGSIAQFIMKILDGYNMTSQDVADTGAKTLSYHRIVEAFKFAYAKRSALGDEYFVEVADIVANLTSEWFAHETRLKISDVTTHNVTYYDPSFELVQDAGTTHLSVLGADGTAASTTSTINLYFGSTSRGKRTGIVFNNEMDDFSTPGTSNSFGLPASPSNFIEPGKMPMSSMAPSIFVDAEGNPVLVTGGAGGSRITTTTAFLAINNLWFGRRLDHANDEPRIHHQLLPDIVKYEEDVDPTILAGLEEKGHETEMRSGYMSAICSVHNTCPQLPDGGVGLDCVHAVSEGRNGGMADGY